MRSSARSRSSSARGTDARGPSARRARAWRGWLAIALFALAGGGCDGCRTCGGGDTTSAGGVGGGDGAESTQGASPGSPFGIASGPVATVSAPAPSSAGPTVLPSDAGVQVNASIVSGTADDLDSTAKLISMRARACYRLTGPSGKTSLGGVTLRVQTDGEGNVTDATADHAEVDKVVLDCIVNNTRRMHLVTGGAPATVVVAISPPDAKK